MAEIARRRFRSFLQETIAGRVPAPAPPAAFVGWHRAGQGGAWQAVCQGATRGACWQRLRAWAGKNALESDELQVLAAGAKPWQATPPKPPPGGAPARLARHQM
jgi:hypothetical protein